MSETITVAGIMFSAEQVKKITLLINGHEIAIDANEKKGKTGRIGY